MPYIGNPSAQRFTSPRAASVYSGDGSTVAFTLEEAVSTDEDILVSVDGVIQEPSVAYAVSSGTTLTFTAAPSSNSGNNIFVYYIARTFGSVSMPDGQNVNAANFSASGTGAITGNTTVGGTLGVTGALTGTTATLTTADNNAQLTLKSTDADANVGPVLDLQRDSSSPADNDVLGIVNFKGENDASEVIDYGSINAYINDASDGTEDGRVIHRLYKGGTNINYVDMKPDEIVFNEDSKDHDFRIESDSMSHQLHMNGSNGKFTINANSAQSPASHFTLFFAAASYSAFAAQETDGGSGAGFFVMRKSGGSTIGQIKRNGTADEVQYVTTSDYRLKENVNYDFDATTTLKKLKPCEFNWISDEKNTTITGFLAHEVQEVYPHAASGEKDAMETYTDSDGKEQTRVEAQGIEKSDLVPLLVKSLQEALTEIDTLKTKVAALESA